MDVCFAFTKKNEEDFIRTKTKAHEWIKFTNKCKTHNQLDSFDVLVEKKEDKFINKLYRKLTFTIKLFF